MRLLLFPHCAAESMPSFQPALSEENQHRCTGSTHKYGERQEYGFATPSERIFEMFRLPGFKTTAEREAERLTSGGAGPSSTAGNHGTASPSSTSGSTRKA